MARKLEPAEVEELGAGPRRLPADEVPSHSTLDLAGQSSGKGTSLALNTPRDLLAAFIRNAPDIVRKMPGFGEVMTAAETDPAQTDALAKNWSNFVERNFDVRKTYDYFGIPHKTPPPEELTPIQRMIGKSVEVASGALPITAAISGPTQIGRQIVNTLAGSALAGPGYEVGGPAGELAGFLTGAGAASGLSRTAAPSVKELKGQAKSLYGKGEAAPPISVPDMNTLRTEVTTDLANFRFDPAIHTKVDEALGHLTRYATRPVPVDIKSYDVMRDGIRKSFKGATPDEGAMLSQMLARVDSLLPAEMQRAAELTRRAKRSESLGTAVKRAESRIGATAHGNALRNEIANVLRSGKEMRYFRPEEADLVGEIVTSPGLNAMRLAGKYAPSRGAFNTAMHAVLGGSAYAGTGSAELALTSALLSEAAKMAATRMTANRIRGVQESIRRGGPAQPNFDVLRALFPALGAQER